MRLIFVFFIVIFIVCTKQDNQDDQCPPWFFYNTTTKTCECYSSPSTDKIIKCAKKEALLKLGYCMTYEEEGGFYVGLCDNVNLKSNSLINTTEDNYIRLPSNVSDLNDYMCGPMNRKGLVCSQCADGFGLAVFSVGQTCTNCTGVWYGVPLYLFIEFVPITIFFFIIVIFRINVTSAPMVAFVLYSQVAVSAFSNIMVSNKLIFNTTITYRFLGVLVLFYGIWNLDFFRFIIPPFCVSSHLKPVHITFLYFISAFYPLCLIAVSWICIHLYSRNFKPLVWLWDKLKQNLRKRFNVDWHATNTIINVFATFFLLSYAKLVFSSLRALNYGILLNVNNLSLQQTLHVRSDPSMIYFGEEHLPFAITSVFIFLLAVLPIPLLLALYPIRSVRTLLFKFLIGGHTKAAINIFVQKFYSCYRDSTDGGRDMRSLVCLYFFLRVLIHFVTVHQIPPNVGFSILVFIYIACSTLIALAQPYKKPYMNNADTLILVNLALLSLILSQLNGRLSTAFTQFFYISGSMLASIPLLAITGVLIYKIIRKMTKLPCCKSLLRSHGQKDLDDTEDYDLESRDDPELQIHSVKVEENDQEHNSENEHIQ